jgi:hypothetical protein
MSARGHRFGIETAKESIVAKRLRSHSAAVTAADLSGLFNQPEHLLLVTLPISVRHTRRRCRHPVTRTNEKVAPTS